MGFEGKPTKSVSFAPAVKSWRITRSMTGNRSIEDLRRRDRIVIGAFFVLSAALSLVAWLLDPRRVDANWPRVFGSYVLNFLFLLPSFLGLRWGFVLNALMFGIYVVTALLLATRRSYNLLGWMEVACVAAFATYSLWRLRTWPAESPAVSPPAAS